MNDFHIDHGKHFINYLHIYIRFIVLFGISSTALSHIFLNKKLKRIEKSLTGENNTADTGEAHVPLRENTCP